MYNIHALRYVVFIKMCILYIYIYVYIYIMYIMYIYIYTILSNIFLQVGRKDTGR